MRNLVTFWQSADPVVGRTWAAALMRGIAEHSPHLTNLMRGIIARNGSDAVGCRHRGDPGCGAGTSCLPMVAIQKVSQFNGILATPEVLVCTCSCVWQ